MRPDLAFAIKAAWSYLRRGVDYEEALFRLVTRYAESRKDLPYVECLCKLSLQSLGQFAVTLSIYKGNFGHRIDNFSSFASLFDLRSFLCYDIELTSV